MPSIDWQTLGTGDVLGHLRSDLKRTSSSAWVIGPWIDGFFAEILVTSLPAKAVLRVVTRPSSGANSSFAEHALAARAYFRERSNTVVRLLTSLHAKLVVIDEHVVYCGSTNWYRYSLQESCEIVFRGPVASVSGLLDQIQVIWDQASDDEQPIDEISKWRETAEGYMKEVIDPVAEAKLKEVPGSFVIRRPARRRGKLT